MVTLDYPIHDRVLFLQSAILQELLDYNRLARLRDAELRSPDHALTIPELFETLQMAVWREVLQPEGTPRLSSLRRGLQREHLRLMSDMVRRTIAAPEDARTLAWYNLRQLRSALDRTLRKANKLDAYTRAHLEETRDRIDKTLNAQLQSQ
ncbi:zinc-dependent metalloprotease [Leptothermofonsia sichuanensis E412]|nr:zinc-dependent metalloprotease [Leptothermofonsia sichuanensis E412]